MLLGIVVVASVLITAWYYWKPFFDQRQILKLTDFIAWAVKGLGVPTLFWILINCGVMWSSGPFMQEVSVAKNAGGSGWIDVLLYYAGTGMAVISSWWLAFSLAWIVWWLIRNSPQENRDDFKTHAVFWSFLMVPVGALILFFGGWFAGGFAACAWLLPMAHYTTPLLIKRKAPTFYSAAIARTKMGKFGEAEVEILKQLEECEDDYEGWMMLAELYAEHFQDVDTADQTVRDLCAQPGLNPGQVYTALSRLADWHVTLGDDPFAARTVLEIVCKAYPGTHLDRLAQAKMGQIPKSRAELLERRQGRKLRLPSLRDDLETDEPESSRVEAAAAANECVNRLKVDPDDIGTREKLARLFAEQLGRADLGIEQSNLLLEMPDQPESKVAEWLAQIGAWQIKYLRNLDAGRETLRRLIADYPQTPQAFAAQRRLNLLEMDARLRRKPQGRKMDA
jgi:hypothetical protein